MNKHQSVEVAYALRLKSLLNLGLENFDPHISAQLTHARSLALGKQAHATQWAPKENLAPVYLGHSSAAPSSFFSQRPSWAVWGLALFTLVLTLLVVDDWQETQQIQQVAEVDAMILADDLPLSAHLDPGFISVLKTNE